MERKNAVKKWLWYFSITAAAILLYKLYDNFAEAVGMVGNLIGILAPFVGGLVLAFLLYRPSQWFEKLLKKGNSKVWLRLARPVALTITYLLLLGILTLVAWLVIPAMVSGLQDLVRAMPGYIDTAVKMAQEWDNAGGWLAELHLTEKLSEARGYLAEALPKLLTMENIGNALKGVGSFASSLLDVFIAVIVSVYMLAGREHLTAAVKNLCSLFFKDKTMVSITDYGHRTARIFSHYFYGTLLDALCVGVVISIGLALFRVPFAPLLGMLVGLMNIIPYFGAIIGGLGVALITLLSTNVYTAIGVAIYLLVVQQLDGNIIQPRLVGHSVGLRPIYVLLSVTLFGGLFGFWGVVFAPPLMAIIQMVVRDATIARKARAAAASTPDNTNEE